MPLTAAHIVGMVVTLLALTLLGWYSGRNVKDAGEFTSGGKSGSIMMVGMIMGTLVGGTSTVGTAQLAFEYGLSAWWFTLGGGLGCLALAFFTKPFRRSGCTTISQVIAQEYGRKASAIASILSSIGIFINIVTQMLAANGLLTAFLPVSPLVASLIATVLMAFYVVFGGLKGTGLGGVFKLVLLYAAVITGGILALNLSGGFSSLYNSLDHSRFFNLFARGLTKDGGAGLSLILGVLSTQTYVQAVWATSTDQKARRGALLSALLIPPIGAGGILIGMYMRLHYPNIVAGNAFSAFIMQHMPPLFGGIALAALLVAIVGTGAGLSLGTATIMMNDLIKPRRKQPFQSDRHELRFTRILILFILALAVFLSIGDLGDIIMDWAFMAMGLRAAVIFVPMCGALFLKGRIKTPYVMAAMVLAPASILLGKVLLSALNSALDPLFIGMAVSLFVTFLGYRRAPNALAQ